MSEQLSSGLLYDNLQYLAKLYRYRIHHARPAIFMVW